MHGKSANGAAGAQPSKQLGLNIQDVADAAGVSKTTVSHVLTGNRPVSPATRRKVEQVMEELGYKPNFFAQALNTQRSQTIALIAQDLTNPFYPALARGVQIAVADSPHVVMLFDAGASGGAVGNFIEAAIQRRVDGIVVAVSPFQDELAVLRQAGIPVVAVGPGYDDLAVDSVTADDARIGYDATRTLLAKGHTHVGVVTGPVSSATAIDRLRGFERAMNEVGLEVPSSYVVEGDWTRDSGYSAVRHMLSLQQPPTAVFCGNDLMAIGAMDAAVEHGISLPDDLAIIGVDDIDAASLLRPALTTVQIPAQEIGRAAGELLLQRITQGDSSAYRHVLIRHQVMNRQTVGEL